MRYLLLHPPSYRPSAIAAALESEQVFLREIRGPRELIPSDHPTVFLLDSASRSFFPIDAMTRFVDEGGAIIAVGGPGEDDIPDELPVDLLSSFMRHEVGTRQVLCALRSAYRESASRTEAAGLTREMTEMARVGIALSTERDLRTLLKTILDQAQSISQSDAGSLYLVERTDGEPTHLRFVLAQGESRPDAPFVETTMVISVESMAGWVTLRGRPLVIEDAYEIEPDREYKHNRYFDDHYDYRTKSMLTIPMKDQKDNIIGVLQLINRKREPGKILRTAADFDRDVSSYTPRVVELVSALAAQAAVAIDNSRLYRDIERLFEGFVRASVTAIEQRDPTTSGHSFRVAELTVKLAETVDASNEGICRNLHYTSEQVREIRYASLLHDFGKVGVREQVLVKAKKLYPRDIELIRQRYAFVRRTVERDFHRRRAEHLEKFGRDGYDEFVERIRGERLEEIAKLEHFLGVVEKANEPTVLEEEGFKDLQLFGQRQYEDVQGQSRPLLTEDEYRFLSIRRGSLDSDERLEIESHVTHTFRFLRQIPWTRELANVPEIAYGHHERLDGSGYPQRLFEGEIPAQARMMAISDIYDALTAQDRPYKAAISTERALDILSAEVRGGHLDPDLYEVFVGAKVYAVTKPPAGD